MIVTLVFPYANCSCTVVLPRPTVSPICIRVSKLELVPCSLVKIGGIFMVCKHLTGGKSVDACVFTCQDVTLLRELLVSSVLHCPDKTLTNIP